MNGAAATVGTLSRAVLDGAYSLVDRLAVAETQRQSLLTALSQSEAAAPREAMPGCMSMPILAYGTVRDDRARAIPLASTTVLFDVGRHLLDDVADCQIMPLDNTRAGEAVLLGTGFLSVLPQLALLELDASPACLTRMLHTLLQSLVRIGAGQQADLRLTGSENPSPPVVEDSVRGKTGETYALYAALGAELAEAVPWRVSRLADMGRAFGTALQISSDCSELLMTEPSSDLSAGTRTLPLALHLGRLAGDRRRSFLALLSEARVDLKAQAEVRAQLRQSGVIRACGIVVESYCRRALRALDEAEPLEPAGSELRAKINSIGLFPSAVP